MRLLGWCPEGRDASVVLVPLTTLTMRMVNAGFGPPVPLPTSVNARPPRRANVPVGSVRTAPVGNVMATAGRGVADGGGVPVSVAVGPSVGAGVAEVETRKAAAAVAEGAGVAGWLPHPAIKAAASVKAPSERSIFPPTLVVAEQLPTAVGPVRPRVGRRTQETRAA